MYLRGWGDYLRWSLKLTESDTGGIGAWRPPRLEPRGAGAAVADDRGDRAGRGLERRRPSATARLPLPRPRRAHASSSTTRPSATRPPEHLRPSLAEPAPALHGRGCAVKRLDHVNLLVGRRARQPRLRAGAASATGSTSGSSSTTATESGAWMSLTIAAHELIYVADHYRRPRPPAPPRLLGRHARGVPARGRPVRRQRDPDRGGTVQARRRPGLLPLRLRARRQPDRGDDRRLLRLRPRPPSRSPGPRPSARWGRPGA